MGNREENLEDVRFLEDELFVLDAKGWLENEFLTWEWWVLLSFFVVPWILWFIMKKRKWFVESLLFGMIVMNVTLLLDTVGMQFSFWEYPVEFLPVIPRGFPFDVSMVPVAFILLFQYFQTWKSFIIAQVIMAVAYAFVGEPFCEWLHFVRYIKWNYLYSFVYYIILGIVVRALILKCMMVSKRYYEKNWSPS
ncbi:CBO0543 family protein [Robertmurraya sp. P23]|uniref:CBO0543 family protein n=1 Tax=Robertmurraya sp. P23 TaxID=3436931 RepID=UPI003D9514F1